MFSCAEINDGQLIGCGGDQMRGWHIKIAVAVLGLTLRHYVAECMQCEKKMNMTELRMGKLVSNFFDRSRKGMIYHYFHLNGLIQNLKTCMIMSRNIETVSASLVLTTC